jgi:hypothetical protein
MLGPKPKPFNCAVCHKEHTYGSWEDTEVYFNKDMSIHLGCLQSHYRELISKTKMAFENLKSALELLAPNPPVRKNTLDPNFICAEPLKMIQDAFTNLKGAIHE